MIVIKLYSQLSQNIYKLMNIMRKQIVLYVQKCLLTSKNLLIVIQVNCDNQIKYIFELVKVSFLIRRKFLKKSIFVVHQLLVLSPFQSMFPNGIHACHATLALSFHFSENLTEPGIKTERRKRGPL